MGGQKLTEQQQEIYNSVHEELSGKPWFRKVCADRMPDDGVITEDNISHHIDILVLDTVAMDK